MRQVGAGNGAAVLRVAAALVLAVLVTACAQVYRNHGYVPTEDELAAITVGVDTHDTVAGAIGRPSAAGLLNDEGWYYVQSRYRLRGPREPEEIDRQVVAISFDKDGVVSNVERFGLADGRVVALSRRVTDSSIRGASLISRLMRNFGRFRAEDFIR